MTESKRVEKFMNQKWDAISKASKLSSDISHRLFDEVSLILSQIEGKLKFATGKSILDEQPQIADKHTRKVVSEAKEKVSETRKVLTNIIKELRKGTDDLI